MSRLDRAYSVDFQKLDPDVRRGQQSYPLAIGGKLFVTTNDDNVFALDGATGKVLWQYKPPNSALFKNFGIVANRGLAYCDGRLFIAQLDMKLVALRPGDGKVLGVVSVSHDVWNASTNYGYSETSAPICANHRVLVGAAGSEYGIRGFVMAYTTDLRPAWPSPFWTIPPDLQSWRRTSRVVGGGAVWTPVTVDSGTNTVYFGTGSATPLYFPALRPGADPANGRAGRRRPGDRAPEVVAAADRRQSVGLRRLAAATRLPGQGRRHGARRRLRGDDGGRLVRVRRQDREPVPRAREGHRPRGASAPPSGRARDRLPVLARRPELLARFVRPATNYVFNAAAETAAVLVQQKLTPTQKRRKLLLGDVYLGLQNGNFGGALAGWHDHGSISAIDVSSGRRVWKFRTPEPERGGVTTTASGLGFAGGGDGVLRAFDLRRRARCSGHSRPAIRSRPGRRSSLRAAGSTSRSRSGGTPTSSNGGTVSQLFVFTLGTGTTARTTQSVSDRGVLARDRHRARPAAPHARRRPAGGVRITVSGGAVPLALWRADSSNEIHVVAGRLGLRGKPVAGAVVAVDRYRLPRRTDAQGRFSVLVDSTLARRHPIHVAAASHATVGGRPLTAGERKTLSHASGGVSVGYRLVGLRARPSARGVFVTGRAVRVDGAPAPGVVLLSYRLQGTITDASGNPVRGATVVTRTTDRDFWTFSQPSNANGHYVSYFSASDEAGSDPVSLSVQVASGTSLVGSGVRNVSFSRLHSAHDGREAALDRYDARPPGVDTGGGRVLSWACSWESPDRAA